MPTIHSILLIKQHFIFTWFDFKPRALWFISDYYFERRSPCNGRCRAYSLARRGMGSLSNTSFMARFQSLRASQPAVLQHGHIKFRIDSDIVWKRFNFSYNMSKLSWQPLQRLAWKTFQSFILTFYTNISQCLDCTRGLETIQLRSYTLSGCLKIGEMKRETERKKNKNTD